MRLKSYTIFELTPPAFLDRKLSSTSQLISAIHNLKNCGLSLEITSTKQSGILFMARVASTQSIVIKNLMHAYLPEAKVKEVKEYLGYQNNVVYDFYQTRHFAYPLHNFDTNPDFDPISYITGSMTQLEGDQRLTYQLMIKPKIVKDIPELRKRILHNEELSSILVKKSSLRTTKVMNLISTSLLGITGFITDSIHGPSHYSNYKQLRSIENTSLINSHVKPARQLTTFETELIDSINSKISQSQYEVTVRLILSNFNKSETKDKIDTFESAVKIYSVSGYQDFNKRIVSDASLAVDRTGSKYKNIFSLAEIASLYHFPHSMGGKTENVVRSLSKTLPAPVSLKNNTKLDILLGTNIYHGTSTPIGLTLEQRRMHTYVIGKTGTGKTTLLTNSIYQDMASGKGLAVLDPHGDMFQELLAIVPEHRRKDVVVFDPSDRNFPIGLNILDPGLDFDDDEDKEQWITSNVLSVFAKLADEKLWGPRMEHVLRSTTLTALQTPNPSLYTIQRLLTDRLYQRTVAKTLKDPVLKQFWQKEFALMGGMQLANVTQPLTNRLGHFITTKMSRHILMQEKSTLRIADIMNEGKILLVNLSKGDIGEDQSTFFGTIITSFIWMAAYQRTKIPEKQRRDFFLYVDEFQNFATPRFAEITSEGRKFRVSLIVSHQNIAQIEDKNILKVMAGNAHTIIALKSSPDDEAFTLPFMKPVVERGDIVNLAPYHFYMKTTADESEDAFSGVTVPLEVEASDDIRQEVIAYSQKQYGTPKKEVEAYMDKLFNQPKSGKNSSEKSSDNKAKGQDSAKVHLCIKALIK